MAEFAAAAATAFATAGGETIAATSAAALADGTIAGEAGAFAASAGAAAGASGGFFSALGGVSTVGSILSGAATIGSVLSAQRAGEQKADALESQAADTDLSLRAEDNNALQRQNSLKAALVKTIGDRDVATAASGVDLSFGTPVAAREQDVKQTNLALAIDDDTTSFNRARLLERAASYRQMAGEARAGGLAKSAGLALEGSAKLLRRG